MAERVRGSGISASKAGKKTHASTRVSAHTKRAPAFWTGGPWGPVLISGASLWSAFLRCHHASGDKTCQFIRTRFRSAQFQDENNADLASVESREKPSPTTSLWTAVEARLLRHLSNASEGRRNATKGNPYEDPTQLGRVMREEGWWPKLLRSVSIITATKAVGPTQGLTVYINTKYSDFIGDVQTADGTWRKLW